MGYSNEVVRKARAELASRKADHESRTNARLQEAYMKVPRIKEIDIMLRKSMALAMQAVFQTGGDAKFAMEEVKQANLALQAEKKASHRGHKVLHNRYRLQQQTYSATGRILQWSHNSYHRKIR